MSSRLNYEQLNVGESWLSDRRTITETDVVNFATSTGDLNPLHIDREFACNSRYGQPIAHGLLGMCWVAGLGSNAPSVNTIAFLAVRNWEFLKPLYFGDTVHATSTVLEKHSKGRKIGKVVWQLQLVNQRDEVTQQGVFETLVCVGTSIPKPHFSKRSSVAGNDPTTQDEGSMAHDDPSSS